MTPDLRAIVNAPPLNSRNFPSSDRVPSGKMKTFRFIPIGVCLCQCTRTHTHEHAHKYTHTHTHTKGFDGHFERLKLALLGCPRDQYMLGRLHIGPQHRYLKDSTRVSSSMRLCVCRRAGVLVHACMHVCMHATFTSSALAKDQRRRWPRYPWSTGTSNQDI